MSAPALITWSPGDRGPDRDSVGAASLGVRIPADLVRPLDHHHGVSAVRHHGPGGYLGAGAGLDGDLGRRASVDRPDEVEVGRIGLVGAEGVAGADRVPVHRGAVEPRHVDGGVDPLREDAAAGVL